MPVFKVPEEGVGRLAAGLPQRWGLAMIEGKSWGWGTDRGDNRRDRPL
jgi:hypothetical protein